MGESFTCNHSGAAFGFAPEAASSPPVAAGKGGNITFLTFANVDHMGSARKFFYIKAARNWDVVWPTNSIDRAGVTLHLPAQSQAPLRGNKNDSNIVHLCVLSHRLISCSEGPDGLKQRNS